MASASNLVDPKFNQQNESKSVSLNDALCGGAAGIVVGSLAGSLMGNGSTAMTTASGIIGAAALPAMLRLLNVLMKRMEKTQKTTVLQPEEEENPINRLFAWVAANKVALGIVSGGGIGTILYSKFNASNIKSTNELTIKLCEALVEAEAILGVVAFTQCILFAFNVVQYQELRSMAQNINDPNHSIMKKITEIGEQIDSITTSMAQPGYKLVEVVIQMKSVAMAIERVYRSIRKLQLQVLASKNRAITAGLVGSILSFGTGVACVVTKSIGWLSGVAITAGAATAGLAWFASTEAQRSMDNLEKMRIQTEDLHQRLQSQMCRVPGVLEKQALGPRN